MKDQYIYIYTCIKRVIVHQTTERINIYIYTYIYIYIYSSKKKQNKKYDDGIITK